MSGTAFANSSSQRSYAKRGPDRSAHVHPQLKLQKTVRRRRPRQRARRQRDPNENIELGPLLHGDEDASFSVLVRDRFQYLLSVYRHLSRKKTRHSAKQWLKGQCLSFGVPFEAKKPRTTISHLAREQTSRSHWTTQRAEKAFVKHAPLRVIRMSKRDLALSSSSNLHH